jgi:hypothetical protein
MALSWRKTVAAPTTLLDPWRRFPRDERRDLRQGWCSGIVSALLDATVVAWHRRGFARFWA